VAATLSMMPVTPKVAKLREAFFAR
jgi:hypothetical protein